MKKPTHLIINNPYAAPRRYWKYDRQRQSFDETAGRRPAGYMIATPGQSNPNDPGQFVEITLVKAIRPRVDVWREGGYAGITATTRALLEHWRDIDQRDSSKRFFFCQLEAIETLIWLTEGPVALRGGIDIPGDGGPFTRLCSKMATGSGKTIVMAMIMAWQVLNKAANNQDARFSKNILLVAPGLTVHTRLEVLQTSGPENYFQLFSIVPAGMMETLRTHGRVQIIHWHKLMWESDEKLARKKGVDKRGKRSDDAWLRDVLGDMGKARSLTVINDEAHHAWRISGTVANKDMSREEREQATRWISGLDRIHRARGILNCFDLSATPFVPGKNASDDDLFNWIVSDFGLNDAIESGLVKTPRVVVRDDAVPNAGDYKPKLYHIYAATDEHGNRIADDLNRSAEPQETLPQLVTTAYTLLGKDWAEWRRIWHAEWKKKAKGQGQPFLPPVMITVANRIETASRIKFAFDHGDIPVPELCDPQLTLQIDSASLNEAEAQDAGSSAISSVEVGTEEESGGPVKKQSKAERAESIRRMVATVGRPGEPGEKLQHLISVAMLSEGWDARTVTHIMGLRAFTSQLLCEQVVGRGLRRTNYDIQKQGLGGLEEPAKGKPQEAEELPFVFRPEYVNVFGVPFSFMPHEDSGEEAPAPSNQPILVTALLERGKEMEITWPQVLRIEHALTPRLSVDWKNVPVLKIDASQVPLSAELAPTVDGKPDITRLTSIRLQEIAEQFRLQTIIFQAARKVFDQERPAWRGSPEFLLGQLIGLVEQFLRSDRLQIVPELFSQSDLHRRVLLTLSMSRIVQHVKSAVRDGNTESRKLVLDQANPMRSTGDMRPWFTSRPCEPTRRSHISHCVYDSTWEAAEAHWLDHPDTVGRVAAWARNDHLGFEIRYIYAGGVSKYRPDFLIRLRNGKILVLEVKGEDTPRDRVKRAAMEEWVDAVNAEKRFGQWCHDVSFSPSDILDILSRHLSDPAR